MAKQYPVYPIGIPGTPWSEVERTAWRAAQSKKRDYHTDVVVKLRSILEADRALSDKVELIEHGRVDYSSKFDGSVGAYTLVAVKSKTWDPTKFTALVTGGVHGYETSGVMGAIKFIQEKMSSYGDKVNVLVLPCVTPWAYETINRWNPEAIDPNRSFNWEKPGCEEAGLAMKIIRTLTAGTRGVLVHTDLHETTDTDNSEFGPAKFARNGTEPEPWSEIPDGFYVVGDTDRPDQLDFHVAMLNAVKKVTHIAPSDEKKCLIGEPIVVEGLVSIPCKALFLCAAQTDAGFVVTTEVYPDSAKTSPEECNLAQMVCVVAALDYVLGHAASKV